MDIERVLSLSEGIPEEDRLGMILSNRIDMGCEAGGLISVKAFPQLINDLIVWRDSQNDFDTPELRAEVQGILNHHGLD